VALTPTTLTYMVVDSGSGTTVLQVHSTNQGIDNSTAECLIPLDAGHAGGTVRIMSEGEPDYDGAQVIGSSGTLYNQIAAGTPQVDITINYSTAETWLSLRFVKDGSASVYTDMATFIVTDLTVGGTAEGIAVAPTNLTVQVSSGAVQAVTTLTVLASTDAASAATALTVEATAGVIAALTALTLSWPDGAANAATALTVNGSGGATAATMIAVIGAGHSPNWTARCLIDGIDVSARLRGQASVTAEEGAARIASVTLLPASGPVVPLDYVGKTIHIDYVLLIDGVPVPRRLFTGRIDTPSYNPATALLHLDCTDDLQNRVAALDRSVIDALVGGRFAEAVQGEMDDAWDYVKARLETVAASLDSSASGGLRVTEWEGADVWATWGKSDLLYEHATLALPQRSTLVNKVHIEFDYRYPRLRQRYTSSGWSGTNIDMAPVGWAYPTQQDILGAAGGSGWMVTKAVFYPAPAAVPHSSGGFIRPPEGSIDMAILHLAQRHSQTVTEKYGILVTADESVAANGDLAYTLRGALESEFDGGAWEAALDVEPLMPDGGDMDYAPDAPRADAEYAIQTLLDMARVKIFGSHRSARVGNAVLCNPDLDVDKRVAIATGDVEAVGKVARVIHTLDFQAGSAVSAFDLAIFGAGGAGILTPDMLAPPDPPAAAAETQDWPGEVLSMWVNTYGVTPYSDSLMGLLLNPPETISVEDVPGQGSVSYPNPFYVAGSYPVTGFRVQMPGVADADRNPLDLPVNDARSIVIPVDPLTFTVA
jgi:hypothetical protein